MEPGDVLYFPAGMWHKVETLEMGVSINISLMGTTYASLFCKTLEHLLLEKEEWREIICSARQTGCDAVEKMRALISDLPSAIEKLQNNGLAEGMLPPVLRHPPDFTLVKEEEEDEQDGNEDIDERNVHEEEVSGGEDVGIDVSTGITEGEASDEADPVDCEGNNNRFSIEDEDGDEDEDEDEMVVDLDDFEIPGEFNSMTPSRQHWRKNPLASLMRMTDVKSFFGNAKSRDYKDNESLFILNVNFAGNEMHESTVRVIMRDGSGQLENFCSLKGDNLDAAIKNMDAPPSALVYFGYIV